MVAKSAASTYTTGIYADSKCAGTAIQTSQVTSTKMLDGKCMCYEAITAGTRVFVKQCATSCTSSTEVVDQYLCAAAGCGACSKSGTGTTNRGEACSPLEWKSAGALGGADFKAYSYNPSGLSVCSGALGSVPSTVLVIVLMVLSAGFVL